MDNLTHISNVEACNLLGNRGLEDGYPIYGTLDAKKLAPAKTDGYKNFKVSMRKHESVILRAEATQSTSILGLGILNAFTGFYNIYYWSKRMITAVQRSDLESQIESIVRVIAAPLAISNSVENIVLILATLFRGITIFALSFASTVVGGVFLLLELSLEVYRIFSSIFFMKEFGHAETEKMLKSISLTEDGDFKEQLDQIKRTLIDNKTALIEASVYWLYKEALNSLIIYERNPSRGQTQLIKNSLALLRIGILKTKLVKIERSVFHLTAKEEAQIEKKVAKALKKSNESENDIRQECRKMFKKGKLDHFSRRVGSGVAQIFMDIKPYLYSSANAKSSYTIKRTEVLLTDLFHELHSRNKKAIIVHLVGVLTLGVGLSLLLLSYFGAIEALKLSVAVCVMILQVGRQLAPKSFLDHGKIYFSFNPWIEEFNRYFKRNTKTVEFVPLQMMNAESKAIVIPEQKTRVEENAESYV